MLLKKAAAVLAAATIGGILMGATPALASSGGCIDGDACLYYSPGEQGAFFGKGEAGNYDGEYFGGGGAGDGQPVINDAASVRNLDWKYTLFVYYSANESGPFQQVSPRSVADLSWVNWGGTWYNMRNNNHSQGWQQL